MNKIQEVSSSLNAIGKRLEALGYDLAALDKDNPYNPNPQVFDAYMDKMEAQADASPALPNVFDVDFNLLEKSKIELIKAINHDSYDENMLAGLLTVVNHLQFCAVKSGGVDENVVFPLIAHTVRLYAYVTVVVPKAMSAKDAVLIAANCDYCWDISAEGVDVVWSMNEAMNIDVFLDDAQVDSFKSHSIIGSDEAPNKGTSGKTYEVGIYFNIEVEINDAANEEDAIDEAESIEFIGEITAHNLSVSWKHSDGFESTAEAHVVERSI